MGANKVKVILIGGALVLAVLLFMAPKTLPKQGVDPGTGAPNIAENATLDVYLRMATKTIEPAQNRNLDRWILAKMYDSLTAFWDKRKRPDLASVYAEEFTKSGKTSVAWLKAGNRYYYAVGFCGDKTEVPVLYQCAMRCFDKAVN